MVQLVEKIQRKSSVVPQPDMQELLEHRGIVSDDRLPEEKAVSMRSPEERRKLIDTA